MTSASIPVDLHSPGQVFACLGFVEAADVLLGTVEGGFDWQDPDDVRFRLAASGDEDPIVRVLRFLDEATVKSVAPVESAARRSGMLTPSPCRVRQVYSHSLIRKVRPHCRHNSKMVPDTSS